MSFLGSISTQRQQLAEMEKQHQRKQKKTLKEELDYAMTKGEITPKEHTTRAIQILEEYKSIVNNIMEENFGDQ